MTRQMQVYGKIYDIVAQNLQKAGKAFDYGKAAFLCNVGQHPQAIDISRYEKLPNPQFCQAVFLAVYRRLPEGKEYARWSAKFGMGRHRFRRELLGAVFTSNVAAINQIHLANGPYAHLTNGPYAHLANGSHAHLANSPHAHLGNGPHAHLANGPCTAPCTRIRYRMLGRLYGLTDKASLRQLGRKMPKPIQKIIRKVFL